MERTLFDFINCNDLLRDNCVVLFNDKKDDSFGRCWLSAERNIMVEEYHRLQCCEKGKDFYKGKEYILSFVTCGKCTSELYGVYRKKGVVDKEDVQRLERFPFQKWYDWVGGCTDSGKWQYYYDIERVGGFDELTGALRVKYKSGKTHNSCQYTEYALRNATIIDFPEQFREKYFK